MSKFCPKCNTKNEDTVKFCRKCGTAMSEGLETNIKKASSEPSTIDKKNSTSSTKNNKNILIAGAAIICFIVIGLVLVSLGSDSVEDSADISSMRIYNGMINFDPELGNKGCSVFVGEEYADKDVKISVVYKKGGQDLNPKKILSRAVDYDGYIRVPLEDEFDEYPERAHITLYDSDGNYLDGNSVALSSNDKTTLF